MKKKRYRGGFSAFQWGDLTVTQYDSGCLRSIVFRCYANIDIEIDPIYQTLGAYHEDKYASEHNVNRREIVVRHHIIPEVEYSGRVDFELEDGSITETKSSLRKKHKLQNDPKINHLGQLTSYLNWLERSIGRVDWGQYTEDLKQTDHKNFEVEIAKDGQLIINGNLSPYYAQDQLEHMTKAAELISSWKLHEVRPLNWDDKYKSPCTFCPFKSVCDKYDAGLITNDEALYEAREKLINNERRKL